MDEQQVLKRRENALRTVNRIINIVDELYTGVDPAYEDEEAAVVLRTMVPASGIEVTGEHMKNFTKELPDGASVDVNKYQNNLIIDIKLL